MSYLHVLMCKFPVSEIQNNKKINKLEKRYLINSVNVMTQPEPDLKEIVKTSKRKNTFGKKGAFIIVNFALDLSKIVKC